MLKEASPARRADGLVVCVSIGLGQAYTSVSGSIRRTSQTHHKVVGENAPAETVRLLSIFTRCRAGDDGVARTFQSLGRDNFEGLDWSGALDAGQFTGSTRVDDGLLMWRQLVRRVG